MVKADQKKLNNGTEEIRAYVPPAWSDPESYKRDGELRDKLIEIGIGDIDDLQTVSVDGEDESRKGPFDRATLRRLSLRDGDRVIKDLFVKIYTPNFKTAPSRVMSEINKSRDLYDVVRYQYDQIKFWNKHNLPSAQVIGFTHDLRRIEDTDVEVYALLLEYTETATHDLDHRAITQEVRFRKNNRLNPLIDEETRDMFPRDIEELRSMSKDLAKSRLATINRFALVTPKVKEENLFVAEFKDPIQHYLQKSCDYLRAIILLKHFKEGKISLDEINRGEIFEGITRHINEVCAEFNDIGKFLIEPLTTRKWYVHGDEFPHHFVYWNEDESRIFDACQTRFGQVIESKAKALLSPVCDLSYIEIQDLFLESEEERLKEERIFKRTDTREQVRLFDRIALLESLFSLGRKAQDVLFYTGHYNIFSQKTVPYENRKSRLLRFPENRGAPEFITYDFSEEMVTPVIRDRITERLNYMMGGKNIVYKLTEAEKESTRKISEFYQKQIF